MAPVIGPTSSMPTGSIATLPSVRNEPTRDRRSCDTSRVIVVSRSVPEMEMTVFFGQASCAPMAAGKPKPMVPAPPEESQW